MSDKTKKAKIAALQKLGASPDLASSVAERQSSDYVVSHEPPSVTNIDDSGGSPVVINRWVNPATREVNDQDNDFATSEPLLQAEYLGHVPQDLVTSYAADKLGQNMDTTTRRHVMNADGKGSVQVADPSGNLLNNADPTNPPNDPTANNSYTASPLRALQLGDIGIGEYSKATGQQQPVQDAKPSGLWATMAKLFTGATPPQDGGVNTSPLEPKSRVELQDDGSQDKVPFYLMPNGDESVVDHDQPTPEQQTVTQQAPTTPSPVRQANESRPDTDARLMALQALTGESGELSMLQQEARRQHQQNLIGRAGDDFANTFIPGAQGKPDEFFDQMDRMAEQPVQDAMQRQAYLAKGLGTAAMVGLNASKSTNLDSKTQETDQKLEQMLNDNDPTSPASQWAQNLFASKLHMDPAMFKNMPVRSLAQMSPEFKSIMAEQLRRDVMTNQNLQNEYNRQNSFAIGQNHDLANIYNAGLRARASEMWSKVMGANAQVRAAEFNTKLAQVVNDFEYEPKKDSNGTMVVPNHQIVLMVQKAKGAYANVTDITNRIVQNYKTGGSAYIGYGDRNSKFIEDLSALKTALNSLENNGGQITDGKLAQLKAQIMDPTQARFILDHGGFYAGMAELLVNAKDKLDRLADGGGLTPRTHPLMKIPVGPVNVDNLVGGVGESQSDPIMNPDEAIGGYNKHRVSGPGPQPRPVSGVPETSVVPGGYVAPTDTGDQHPLNSSQPVTEPPRGDFAPPAKNKSSAPTDPGFRLAKDKSGQVVKVVGGKAAGAATPDDIAALKRYYAAGGN